jgi:thiol-disulfide isomerase/thioredoxin
MIKQLTLAAAVMLLGAGAANAVAVPHVQLTSIAALPIVERYPYDESANADAAVADAFARAQKSHKRVLIDLGGNWCGDCIVLANIMQLPEVKAFVVSHFEVVVIDVGRETKNLQIPARFGVSLAGGVPTVLIVEPNGKTLVDSGHIAALEDARHMTPQGIADWLAQWAK